MHVSSIFLQKFLIYCLVHRQKPKKSVISTMVNGCKPVSSTYTQQSEILSVVSLHTKQLHTFSKMQGKCEKSAGCAMGTFQ